MKIFRRYELLFVYLLAAAMSITFLLLAIAGKPAIFAFMWPIIWAMQYTSYAMLRKRYQ